MNERPILFSGPTVRAILEGRKTQTRRVIKPVPIDLDLIEISQGGYVHYRRPAGDPMITEALRTPGYSVRPAKEALLERCPYGQPGDRLWVRETFFPIHKNTDAIYRASNPDDGMAALYGGWKPSIFMPRWASRITLEVVNVRVERLNDITEQDAMAEGVNWQDTAGMARFTAKKLFSELWNSINEKRGFGWNVNPSVWVVEFKRINQ